MAKAKVWQLAPDFSLSFSLDFCINVQFWFHTSNQFSEFNCFFWEEPNQDKKCNVYIIL